MELKDEKIKNFMEKNEEYNSEKNNSEIKKKRRSKNDLNGRMHKCECGKAYLSQLALSNHRKSKHENSISKENENIDNNNSDNSNSNFSKKRRGRPKKNINLINNNFEDPEYHYKLFFKKEYRRKKDHENYNICDFIDLIFQDIYISNREKCLLKINLPQEHPLLSLIMKTEEYNIKLFQNINNKTNISPENCTTNKILNLVNIKSSNKTEEKLKVNNQKPKNFFNFTIEKKAKNISLDKNNEKLINKESQNNRNDSKIINKEIKNIEDELENNSTKSFEIKKIRKLNGKSKKKICDFKMFPSENILNQSNENDLSSSGFNISSKSNNNKKNISKVSESNLSKNVCCDEIFYEYLKNLTKFANQKYFIFSFKFIIIFRECINTYKNIELENSILVLREDIPENIKEFTQYYDAEQAPELCNEFISEYLSSCDYFVFDQSEIPEIIDIIQHFCYWMYENNYTSSRLSLLNIH